jgi:hypothetical protein
LMDGLNELPSEAARLDVAKFRQDYPKVSMIFTMRDLSLGGDFGLEKKLEMQPLTEAQMQAFVRSYVPEQAEAMLRQLKDRLREFGQTPLRNSADGVAGGDSGDRSSGGNSLVEPPQSWNITYCKRNYQTQAGANNISYFSETHIDNYASPSLDAGIHMRLGGAHQGWGGTDEITVNFQNEGFHPVQLIKCSVHWKTLDGSDGYALKPDTKIRWMRLVPWQDGYDNFALPKMLNPGHIIQVTFKLTPLDIQASKIDISKYMEAPSNEWMASSIIYEVFAQIRTESNHVMSGSISYFFPRDGDKSLCVLLECPETLREQACPERNRNQNVTMNFYGTVHGAAGTVQGDQTIQP